MYYKSEWREFMMGNGNGNGMNLDFDEIPMLWVDTYMKLLRGGNLAVAKSTA